MSSEREQCTNRRPSFSRENEREREKEKELDDSAAAVVINSRLKLTKREGEACFTAININLEGGNAIVVISIITVLYFTVDIVDTDVDF